MAWAVQNGNTLLHQAARFGHQDLVSLLLNFADPAQVKLFLTTKNNVRASAPS